jgi:hypothetical protein
MARVRLPFLPPCSHDLNPVSTSTSCVRGDLQKVLSAAVRNFQSIVQEIAYSHHLLSDVITVDDTANVIAVTDHEPGQN